MNTPTDNNELSEKYHSSARSNWSARNGSRSTLPMIQNWLLGTASLVPVVVGLTYMSTYCGRAITRAADPRSTKSSLRS